MDLKKEKIIIYVTAPILAKGLQVQFESWGFTHLELPSSSAQVLGSVHRQRPSLLLLDTELERQESEINCFILARLVQGENHNIPVIFIDKTVEELLPYQDKFKTIMPFSHAWVNKPCHSEDLWQKVYTLLMNA